METKNCNDNTENFAKKELVVFKRVCPYQGDVETTPFIRGKDLTDLGIRTTVAQYELEGCTNIQVYIDGVDKTSEFTPSLSERNLTKENNIMKTVSANYFGNMAEEIKSNPIMSRLGCGKSLY